MSLTRKLSEELLKKPKSEYKPQQICQLEEKLSLLRWGGLPGNHKRGLRPRRSVQLCQLMPSVPW